MASCLTLHIDRGSTVFTSVLSRPAHLHHNESLEQPSVFHSVTHQKQHYLSPFCVAPRICAIVDIRYAFENESLPNIAAVLAGCQFVR